MKTLVLFALWLISSVEEIVSDSDVDVGISLASSKTNENQHVFKFHVGTFADKLPEHLSVRISRGNDKIYESPLSEAMSEFVMHASVLQPGENILDVTFFSSNSGTVFTQTELRVYRSVRKSLLELEDPTSNDIVHFQSTWTVSKYLALGFSLVGFSAIMSAIALRLGPIIYSWFMSGENIKMPIFEPIFPNFPSLPSSMTGSGGVGGSMEGVAAVAGRAPAAGIAGGLPTASIAGGAPMASITGGVPVASIAGGVPVGGIPPGTIPGNAIPGIPTPPDSQPHSFLPFIAAKLFFRWAPSAVLLVWGGVKGWARFFTDSANTMAPEAAAAMATAMEAENVGNFALPRLWRTVVVVVGTVGLRMVAIARRGTGRVFHQHIGVHDLQRFF